MTPSQIQKAAVAKRWKEEEDRYPLPEIKSHQQLFPHNYECELHPGYFYIPWISSRIVISKSGDLIKLLTGNKHKTWTTPKGYLTAAFRVGSSYKSFAIHRIVAMLFCEVPERHDDKSFDELEVNHKDGNKSNNNFDNLEWVTTLENMKHAWSSGFIKTELPVLAKHVVTDEVIKYASISECSRSHGLSVKSLCAHLNSEFYGMIDADDHVYKFDDGKDWPSLRAVKSQDIRVGMNCDCVGENVKTGQKLVFASLSQASRYLNLPLNPLRLSRTRKGTDVPFLDWIFYSLSGKPLSRKLKGG